MSKHGWFCCVSHIYSVVWPYNENYSNPGIQYQDIANWLITIKVLQIHSYINTLRQSAQFTICHASYVYNQRVSSNCYCQTPLRLLTVIQGMLCIPINIVYRYRVPYMTNHLRRKNFVVTSQSLRCRKNICRIVRQYC